MILQLFVVFAGVINCSHAFKAPRKLQCYMEQCYVIKITLNFTEYTLDIHYKR